MSKKKEQEFKLHYVGMTTYTVTTFEREAIKHGVQRSIPFYLLKTLKWGDQILLAAFNNTSKDKKKKEGTAEVFAYFTLTGIAHNLPAEACDKLHDKLDIVFLDTNQMHVNRSCGGYMIGAITVINNTLEDLIAKIEELVEEKEIQSPNAYKWFMTGNYTKLQSFLIQPVKFVRGIVKVKVKGLKLEKQETETANVIWIYNYRKREYMPQLMKERFAVNTEQFDKYLNK